jgi:hypothetical protein
MYKKMPKSALKYFVRLIKLEDLVERRDAFHLEYSILACIDREVSYDAESEYVEIIRETDDFKFIGTGIDFRKTIRKEVASALKSAKFSIYKRLTSGLFAEQESFCQQVMRDVEELISIVGEQLVYTNYPHIADALCSIRDFVTTHRPLPLREPQATRVAVTGLLTKQATGFHYRCYEEGGFNEDKALTRGILGKMFVELRDNLKLIAPDTTIEDFRAIFSGKAVTKRVRWMGVNNQLYCFIQAISPKLRAPGQRKLEKKWATTAACFVNREGETFTERQLQNPGITIGKVCNGREIGELAKILR